MLIDFSWFTYDDGDDENTNNETDTETVADKSEVTSRPTTQNDDHTSSHSNKSLLDMATGNDPSEADEYDDVPDDQPTQLEMVHQELDLLVSTCHSKQVAVRERQDIIEPLL